MPSPSTWVRAAVAVHLPADGDRLERLVVGRGAGRPPTSIGRETPVGEAAPAAAAVAAHDPDDARRPCA